MNETARELLDVYSSRETLPLRRHDLVHLSPIGANTAFLNVATELVDSGCRDYIESLMMKPIGDALVPGIVRRPMEPLENNQIAIGYTSIEKFNGRRLQIPTHVSRNHILSVESPFDVARRPYRERNKCLSALSEARCEADQLGVKLGVWGSAGLELATGLTYTTDHSDLDLTTDTTDIEALKIFLGILRKVEKKLSMRIDMELSLEMGVDIQVKEIFSSSESVLGKSTSRVEILSKKEVLELLKK